MDVNQTPYFLLNSAEELLGASESFAWHARRRALVLAQDQQLRLSTATPTEARQAWNDSRPLALDRHGQLGRLSADDTRLEYDAGGGFESAVDRDLVPVTAPVGVFVDLALGGDGRVALPYVDLGSHAGGLLVFHLGHRWQTHTEEALPEPALRAAVDADNQVWLLGQNTLMLCRGEPLPLDYRPETDRFEPVTVNPHPLRLAAQVPLPADVHPLALCVDTESVYVLVHDDADAQSVLVRARTPDPAARWRAYRLASDAPFVVDIGLLEQGGLALMTVRRSTDREYHERDCLIVALSWDPRRERGRATMVRERYPMRSQTAARFVTTLDETLRYQAEDGPAPLLPILRPRYTTSARMTLPEVLDAGQPDTVWHRVYLDACIPRGTIVRIYARAYNDPAESNAVAYQRQPDPLWNPLASELPYYEGAVESVKGESGLFEILLQRSGGPVRELRGRYLKMRIVMTGDGRSTPAVHAMRIYYPRFSYQTHYLPAHFHQEALPGASDAPATPADLRERFLASFEGMLTPIEGRVAASEALIDPQSAPVSLLPDLGTMVGQRLPAHWPEARRRRLLAQTGRLQRRRGTYAGVCHALDILTDGAVARGEIVVVENFRLRRTMATLLGIDMDDRDHPLTLGTAQSGNSIVGDSLILSEEDARAFLALFDPELATIDERAAVRAFFDRYSHQVSVLLHGAARTLHEAVADQLRASMPAHLQWRILETDHPFVLGLAPLLTVDTFLERAPPPERVTLGSTALGREGLLRNPVAFSPQDVNARPAGPG